MPVKRTSLAARRKVVGFSQDELAERVRVDRSTIARWENGETAPQPSKRPEVARALRVSAEQLDELLTGQSPVTSRLGSEGGSIRLPDGKRLCGACGLPLSRYNSGNVCQACLSARQKGDPARRVNAGAFRDSVNISPEFWDEQETVNALRAGDIGRILELVLDSANVSQSILGRACGLDQGKVSVIVNGARNPKNIEVIDRIATGLDMPDHARVILGLAPKSIGSGSHELSTVLDVTSDRSASDDTGEAEYEPDIIEAVKRREFLVELTASASLGAIGLPLEAARHGLNHSAVQERSMTDVDEWNEIVREYGESYLAAAPADLIKPLVTDIIGLQSALQRNVSTDSGQDLMRAAALLSVFIAQTMMNMGQVHESRRWWRTAKSSADRSGDPYCVLWVRAREINRTSAYRPASATLLLTQEAEKHLDRAPVDAVLEFLSAKAVTLVRVGRPQQAENVLNQIRRLSDGLAGESGSLLVWSRAGGLHGIESFVYSRLGDFEKTQSANELALELHDSSNVRWRADDEMKLAFCLVRKGDVTEGLSHAQDVVAQLPQQQRTVQIVSDARELFTAIPSQGRQLNAAQDYHEWLNSL